MPAVQQDLTQDRADVMSDLLRRQSGRRPHAEAVIFPTERVTFRDLEDRSEAFARSLLALGVRPKDNVAIMLPNCLDYALAAHGIAMIGARIVPVNLRFKETELTNLLADSDAVMLLVAGASDYTIGETSPAEAVAAVFPALGSQDPRRLSLEAIPKLQAMVCLNGVPVPGSLSRAEFDAAAQLTSDDAMAAARSEFGPDDLAMIMSTSGTTARPKGAMITHEAIVRQADCIADWGYRLTAEDRFWTPLPMFHTGGMMSMLACLAAGAAYCHAGRYDAASALTQLEQERITVGMPTFEPLWLPILELPRFEEADLSHLRLIQLTCVPEQGRLLQARLPTAKNIRCTGMTESTSFFAFNRPEDPLDVRVSTDGYPIPTVQIKIADPDSGQEVATGAIGEAIIKGVGCFVGYYNAPEVNAEAFTADGWFRTGDLARFDGEGRYTFVGRIKDMLKVGGENVAAAEVEDYLTRHPAVRMVQVVAAPDRRLAEVPAAFVELKAGAELTEPELIDFCLGKIATFKVPRYVRFVTEWPMSGTKIQKYKLRAAIADELAHDGIVEAPRLDSRRVSAG